MTDQFGRNADRYRFGINGFAFDGIGPAARNDNDGLSRNKNTYAAIHACDIQYQKGWM